MTILRTTHNFNGRYDKVPVIKALRAVAGLGLKEAKDGVELAADGVPFEFDGNIQPHAHYDSMQVFKENGFNFVEVDSKTSVVLESVKQSAVFATKSGENELAHLLLNVLMDYEKLIVDREAALIENAEARKIRDQAEKVRQAEREALQHEREMRQADFARVNLDKKEQEQRMRQDRNK